MNLQYKFNMSSTVLLARCLNVYSCSGNLKTNDNSQSVIMLVFQLFFFSVGFYEFNDNNRAELQVIAS